MVSLWLLESRSLRFSADTPKKLQKAIPTFRSVLSDINSIDFKELYKYTFNFARGEQRVVDVAMAKAFWKMLMEDETVHQEPRDAVEHASHFAKFLEERGTVKSITRDQWMSFRDFCTAVKADLSNWDDNSACE